MLSQGGAAINVAPSDVDEGSAANRRHLRWIRSGVSFSGRERNCCFLNLGNGPFADVSFVSGLDLPDDARGVGRTDWDQDGDVDVWIANRTGPQLRYLRNDTPAARHYLALQLIGRTCNRDAIGAQIELYDTEGKLLGYRELGANFGRGQNTHKVHFGLGDTKGPYSLRIRWPGTSEWQSLPVTGNNVYHVRQQ